MSSPPPPACRPAVLMRLGIPRTLLAVFAFSLLAVAALALTRGDAGAQTIPTVHAQLLSNGVAASDPLIPEAGDTAYHHVELRVGTGTNSATPVTYATADISRIDILIRRGRDGATPDFWDGVASRSGKMAIFASDGTTAGSRLTECDGIYGDRCEFLPAEWKALAGQTGATEATTNVGSIKLAFTLPSDFTNDEVSFEAVLYPNAGGSAWSYARWPTAKYQMPRHKPGQTRRGEKRTAGSAAGIGGLGSDPSKTARRPGR